MTDEMKSCPFCGSIKLEVIDSGEGFYVWCHTCQASSSHEWYTGDDEDCETAKQKAIEAWNTRYKRTCHKVPGKMHYGERRPKCSECGYGLGDSRWLYCPKCGAEICGAEVVDDN